MRHLSDRDYRNFDEKYIKLLMIATALPGEAYLLHSEREQESGYTDLQFRERPPYHVNYQYIFELKYLKKEDKAQLEKAQDKAKEQLTQYLQNDQELRSLHSLKAYTLVVMKDELIWREVSLK
ncbi:MAG: hypothetical protein HC913_18740 [Microscillaceae bacterium]|nr:hypothetical protein [Microscillaceae bacterium]